VTACIVCSTTQSTRGLFATAERLVNLVVIFADRCF